MTLAATDVLNDYSMKRKRKYADVKRRIKKNLSPFFGNPRAEINRDRTVLKRMFSLAIPGILDVPSDQHPPGRVRGGLQGNAASAHALQRGAAARQTAERGRALASQARL